MRDTSPPEPASDPEPAAPAPLPGKPEAGVTAAAPVFVSHSSRNADAAAQIVAALEAAGVPCWVAPRDIPAGADWNHSIMIGINACRALLLVYSRHSVDSDPVKREVERALNRRVPVIPVRLEQSAPSPALEFMISTSQWVDAFPPPVDRHLDAVVAAVKRALDLPHEPARRRDHGHPEYVGPYRVMERLGEGGMGTVYKAEQRSPMKRTVAVKVIKPGFDSNEVIARFESERQALARMDHPHVAKVLDAGADDRGRPYFVMEYVPGVPITQFADQQKLSVRERLELFLQLCEAIAHAHAKAVIHRDIKSTNVLAYSADGHAQVKVIDFGIAKALTGDRLTDRTFNTGRGQAIGTYESMSPEQADGSPDIDVRTDVYSLGALLYELLTGAKPFDHETLARAADDEVRRIIREVDPPRPSTRLSALGDAGGPVAVARRARIDALARELRSELEWIPLKAMRKERDRRYASPLHLAEDVRNYLQGKPLAAAPESRTYLARKFVRRHRGPLTAAAVVAATLVLGVCGTSIGFVNARRAAAEARRQARAAESARTAEAEQRARAEARFNDVRALAHAFLFDFYDKIADLPGSTPAVNLLVTTALTYLDRLRQQSSLDEGLQREVAHAYDRVGAIQGGLGRANVGQTAAARESYAKGLEILQSLARAHPGDLRIQSELATAYTNMGDVTRLGGDARRAIQLYRQSLATLTQAAAAEPSNIRFQDLLIKTHQRIGMAQMVAPDYQGALASFRASNELARQRTRQSPGDAIAKYNLGLSFQDLATVMWMLGDRAGTMSNAKDALATIGELHQADPNNASYQSAMAYCHTKIANALELEGRLDDACEHLRASLALRQRLSSSDPANVEALHELALGHDLLGRLYLQTKDLRPADEQMLRSLTARKRLCEIDPGNAMAQFELAVTYAGIAPIKRALFKDEKLPLPERQVHLRDHLEALQRAKELLTKLSQHDQLPQAGRGMLLIIMAQQATAKAFRLYPDAASQPTTAPTGPAQAGRDPDRGTTLPAAVEPTSR